MQRFQGWSLILIGLLFPAGCATVTPPLQTAPPAHPRSHAELSPDKAAQVCVAAGRELEAKNHEAQAVAQYERARQLDPQVTGAAHRLALLYDRQGDPNRARAEYQRALQEQPRDADLLNDVGFFYYEHGQWTEAEKCLRKALAINTHHTRAWVNLGKVLAQEGRYKESYGAFAKVVKPAEAYSNVGVILAKQGKQEQAKKYFRRALALQPDLKQARTILGVLESAPTAERTKHLPASRRDPDPESHGTSRSG